MPSAPPDSHHSSGWTVVKRGFRQRKEAPRLAHSSSISYRLLPQRAFPTKPTAVSSQTALSISQRVQQVVVALSHTQWWKHTSRLLREAVADSNLAFVQCLGLGSLENTPSTVHQLACALLVRDLFQVPTISCADPLTTCSDAEALTALGVRVAPAQPFERVQIEHCDQSPGGGHGVLFMPHCGIELNDAIVEKWMGLPEGRNVVLLCNVLSRQASEAKAPRLAHLFREGRLEERECPDARVSTRELAFNDLCVTTRVISTKGTL